MDDFLLPCRRPIIVVKSFGVRDAKSSNTKTFSLETNNNKGTTTTTTLTTNGFAVVVNDEGGGGGGFLGDESDDAQKGRWRNW